MGFLYRFKYYLFNNKAMKTSLDINKKTIAIDISSSKRGGPYISSMNIMNSPLKESFKFIPIEYKLSLGRFISFKRIKDIKQQLQAAKPDLILITGLQLSCLHVCIAAKLAGIKHRIIVIRGSSLEAIELSIFKRVLMYLIEFISLWLSTSYYGVSKYASTLSATKFFKRKCKGSIYNIPSLKTVTTPYTRADFKFNDSDIIVASSGRITKEKGYSFLTKAIKEISNPQIKFIIIGDGEYLTEMKIQLKEFIDTNRIVFTGFSNRVLDIISIADIFILPTLHETLSVSLLEAASLSLPLISCRVGGVPEVIENNYNGILVPPADSEALKKAIEYLAINYDKRLEFGIKAKEKVSTIFSNERIVKQLHSLFISELNK